ncbi:uncharacterized protein LOC130774259 [Actinidia eriantha]|uniref:uncharacterized protein LOC130774259 n=1 Tax=Actinidia eriantha TaxID=165200 RepID=UPI002582C499|nr:uncharacterized protein LOC130774259 [Actinidia eriantha]
MAPKSAKKKKQTLALVVSTPEMANGHKRKAQSDSGRKKGKKKKGESSTVPSFERNYLYFPKDKAQERYNLDFSLRKVDLSDEIKRVLKAISDEYNEKILKRMGYELIDNKWILKPTKKREEESALIGKEPSWSRSAKKTLFPEFEEVEMDMRGWKKMRQMKKEMRLFRLGKEEWEEDESEKVEDKEEEKGEEYAEKENEENEEKEVEQEDEQEKGNDENQEKEMADR